MATDSEPSLLGGRPVAEWVVIAALVLILLAAALAVRSTLDDDGAASSGSSSATSAALRSATKRGVPRVQVTIAPDTSGDVRVTEVVRTRSPLASLDLQLPDPASGGGVATPPRVLDLQVEVGDVRVPATVPAAGGRTTLELSARGTEVRLTYVLEGATSQRPAAPDGRAMVQVSPLSRDVGDGDALVTTAVDGVVVHNLVCPDLPVEEQLCGREDGGVWRTTDIPADSARVLAQVDLPQG